MEASLHRFRNTHNDVNFIEDACKKYPRVAYVADGVYSLGGAAPVEELVGQYRTAVAV